MLEPVTVAELKRLCNDNSEQRKRARRVVDINCTHHNALPEYTSKALIPNAFRRPALEELNATGVSKK